MSRVFWFSVLPVLFGSALYFFANIQRVAIPGAIFDRLQEDLALSAPGVTALGSSFMYVYALNQLIVGILVSRYGGKRVILPGALLFCLGSFCFPFAQGGGLYAARALTGLGASAIYLSLVAETIRSFRKNYTIVLSLVIMVGYAGGIVANAPFAAAVHAIGWRPLLILVAVASSVCFLCFSSVAFARKLPPVRKDVPLRFYAFGQVLRERHNAILFLFSGINFGLYYVLQTVIGKKFLEDFCGFAPDRAAWILSLMAALSAVSGVLFAFLSRTFGNRRRIFCRISGAVSLLVFASVLLLIACDMRSGGVALLFCLLATTASLSSITIPMLHETNPRDLAGPAVCVMNFSFYLAVAVFGNAAGMLLNVCAPESKNGVLIYPIGSWLAVFSALAICAAVAFWCSQKLEEPNRARRKICG